MPDAPKLSLNTRSELVSTKLRGLLDDEGTGFLDGVREDHPVRKLLAEAVAVLAERDAQVERLALVNARRLEAQSVYTSVITALIKGGQPDLLALHETITSVKGQGQWFESLLKKIGDMIDAQGFRESKNPEVIRLLGWLDFYLFHEISRGAHYLHFYLSRDLLAALAGVQLRRSISRPEDPAIGGVRDAP